MQEPMSRDVQKPHKWNKKKDADNCIECEQPFKRGDLIYTHTAVNFHVGCAKAYVASLEEIGLNGKAGE